MKDQAIEINVNSLVRVKLTERGLEHLTRMKKDIVQKMPERFQRMLEERDQPFPRQEDGTHEFCLWELMDVFGPMMSMGEEPCFVGNVISITPLQRSIARKTKKKSRRE